MCYFYTSLCLSAVLAAVSLGIGISDRYTKQKGPDLSEPFLAFSYILFFRFCVSFFE